MAEPRGAALGSALGDPPVPPEPLCARRDPSFPSGIAVFPVLMPAAIAWRFPCASRSVCSVNLPSTIVSILRVPFRKAKENSPVYPRALFLSQETVIVVF